MTEWHHKHFMHPGETRTEKMIGQHFYLKGICQTVTKVCKACTVCKSSKKHGKAYGLLPVKMAEVIPWHTLCVDLIGPHTFGEGKNELKLHCLTMIDPATGWFEITEIPNCRADYIANYLEFQWLS